MERRTGNVYITKAKYKQHMKSSCDLDSSDASADFDHKVTEQSCTHEDPHGQARIRVSRAWLADTFRCRACRGRDRGQLERRELRSGSQARRQQEECSPPAKGQRLRGADSGKKRRRQKDSARENLDAMSSRLHALRAWGFGVMTREVGD